jgi:transcriptional regulator with PAS, ATPase and Fis domain
MRYNYPGNVRKLENIIEQSFVLCNGNIIDIEHLSSELQPNKVAASDNAKDKSTLKTMEARHISEALIQYKGNRGDAAKALGINVSTLYRKIKKLKIEIPFTDGRHRGN